MGEAEQDPDPGRRVPTLLWFMLGFVIIVAFAALVAFTGGRVSPRAIGPPAGVPDGP